MLVGVLNIYNIKHFENFVIKLPPTYSQKKCQLLSPGINFVLFLNTDDLSLICNQNEKNSRTHRGNSTYLEFL